MPTSKAQPRSIGSSRPERTPRARSGSPLTARARASTPPAVAADTADMCEIEVIDHAKVARARQALPAPETVATLAETLRALGDRTRLLIVAALAAEDELCVCDLASLVGVSESAVSHSLRTLRQLRVVRYRKVGKIAYYALDDAHVAQLVGEGIRHVEERA